MRLRPARTSSPLPIAGDGNPIHEFQTPDPMQVPIAMNATETVDEDLMEALGYFTEVVGESAGSPASVDAVARSSSSVVDSADVDSMLLSLEIQQLFTSSDEQDKTCKRLNRRRPKHELEYLRSKVAELQEELEKLSTSEVVGPSRAAAVENLVQQTTLVPRGFSSWKDIADRQRHEVDNSMDENRRLRNRLLGQLQVARVLEAAIEQHQREASPWYGVRALAPTTTDAKIFAQLNASAEAQFAEVNAVWTTSGLSNVLHTLAGGLEFKREANGISFRNEEARLLPVSPQAWHGALWKSLHSGLVVKDTALTKDHLNLILRDTLELPNSHKVRVTKRCVFRRHIEQGRIVLVWSGHVEIEGSVSVRIREKGWSTSSTFEFYRGVEQGANSSSNFQLGCMTRTAIHLVPEISEFNSQQEAQMHVGQVTDVIVGTYRHNFGLAHKLLEKMLLSTESSSSGVVRL
ncbi:hypothetical protein PF010_g3767 [Phytophthora fragariae]|uniref:Uncharacterized protein n=1 Tax=Phytophthora fragariae TaxID=53985 RepID=A0A6A3U5Q0_9STRA|nr:hypothetical protein PF003_g28103 [Phytophthora fragariae]KAE8942898.1 hypothetical protein PF009_g7365 [Phytophthora fragariae]KAE9018626.1 hypothetical protein PF011_g6181 [Phytophthora fragariae]KAE9124610.1 hypothetical protein PF007_g6650 [Phytophthora fragariae]KAE9130678.1 hypothetical protein PF010_g3767 [Phytophthora fragariae]